MLKAYKLAIKREGAMKVVFLLSSLFSIFALLSICVFLLSAGLPSIAKIGFVEFIFGLKWYPLGDNPSYGILPMIVGSIYVTALATIMGVSLGLFTAVFLHKFCSKKLALIIRQLVNLLAGIPSVIYGLFGLLLVVPLLRNISPSGVGHGIMAASIILAIMILPTVVSISLDSLNSVSREIFEGALALGASKEQAVFKVVLPAAKSGVFASVVLSIGRAIGETMAVIMVIGGSSQMPTSIFQSIRTMTANIAMGALELTGDAFNALIATGVILLIFTLLLNVGFAFVKNKPKGTRKLSFKLCLGRRFYKFLRIFSIFCACLAVLALMGIVAFILANGLKYVNLNFIFGEYKSANPTILPALAGTFNLVIIALSLAAPIGILTAIYLTEYAKKGRLVKIISVATETLAAIPSIVYGLFGYLVFVVFFGLGFRLAGL